MNYKKLTIKERKQIQEDEKKNERQTDENDEKLDTFY